MGMRPHPGLHAFMDEYRSELGRGHRLLRHNLEMIEHARRTYGDEGALEVAFHIACDVGLVTTEYIRWASGRSDRKVVSKALSIESAPLSEVVKERIR